MATLVYMGEREGEIFAGAFPALESLNATVTSPQVHCYVQYTCLQGLFLFLDRDPSTIAANFGP